jgi:REP element-mobilizing transposase RayT
MARPLRVERPGGWYHVTARGNERRQIFRDDTDRRHFLKLLAEAVQMFGLRLHVYVLMSNHYHLIIELTEANLSRIGGIGVASIHYSFDRSPPFCLMPTS